MIAEIAVLLVASLINFDSPEEIAKRAAQVQGTWRLESVQAEANRLYLPEARPLLTIKGDRLFFGGEEIARVNADLGTEPKVFDLHFKDPERVYEGIYSAEPNTLKVCLNGRFEGVKERPNDFTLEGHPVRRLLTFKRIETDEVIGGSGYVGMALRFDKERNEVVIFDVLEGSPGKKAGLQKDDVLLSVGGTAVTDISSGVEAARRSKPRTEVAFRVRRGDNEMELKVKIGVVPFAVITGLN